MRVVLLGSGGSKGTPKIGCCCPACQLARVESSQARRRYSVFIEDSDTRILVDASPDLRSQIINLDLSFKHIDGVFITHEHYDHVGGLGELYASERDEPLPLYGVGIRELVERNRLNYLEVKNDVRLEDIRPFQRITVGSLTVIPIPLHHSIPTVGFVFLSSDHTKVVLASDTDCRIPKESLEEMKYPDLLFIDAWAENEATAHTLVRELFNGHHKSTFAYQPEFLFHMLLPESLALSTDLHASLAVAVHIGHRCSPHHILARKYDTDRFRIGYDMMEILLSKGEILSIGRVTRPADLYALPSGLFNESLISSQS